MYHRFTLFIFLINWLNGCQTSSETPVFEQETLQLLDSVTHRAQNPDNYFEIVVELQKKSNIDHVFEYAVRNMHMPTNSIVCHLLAQAYARAQYHAIEQEPDNVAAIITLFARFKEQYPELEASLSMYVYFSLSSALRSLINSELIPHLSAKLFLNQIPIDRRVVQFAEFDEFSSVFAHLDKLSRDERVTRAFLAWSYAPFEQYFAQNTLPEFDDYQDFSTTIERAFYRNDLVFFDLARRSKPDFFQRALADQTIVDRPLLLAAALMGHYPLVHYLLVNGADPFLPITINWYTQTSLLQDPEISHTTSTTILEQVLSLCPEQAIGQDLVFDKICRELIARAVIIDQEHFLHIIRTHHIARTRAQELMPELITRYGIHAPHSCCICQ